MKKEKFLIKHANNEKLKEKFIDPYIFEEPQITTEDSISIDKSIDSENMVPDIDTEPETKTETDELDIVFESITEEISVVEATQTELAEIFEGVDIYDVEIDQMVSVSGDIYPPNLQLIGEERIDDPDFTGEGIKIAILDTGIDVDSSELNVAGGVSFIPGTDYDDDNGHGTALAGIIGAKQNGEGIVGIAPEAELYAVKVLDSNGNGYYSDVIKGLEWCMENRIDIVLMSFGADVYSGILHETVQKAYLQDILLVGAAGNADKQVQYPAAYSEVMAVGAVDETNSPIYSYSNSDLIDIFAIGDNITTLSVEGNQTIVAGSSFSAAHVAGVAAEVWSKDLVKTNAMVRQLIIQSATNEDNAIPILDAYQACLDSSEEVDAIPEDDITPIEDDSNEDGQVSIFAECSNDVDVKLGKDIIIYVQFSGNHTKVIAELINERTGAVEKDTTLRNITGSYENGTYTGQKYSFNFGKVDTCDLYHVEFTPYQEDENGDEVVAWPFESDSFKIVAPDLKCTSINTDVEDVVTKKSMRVKVGVSNEGDASFIGEAEVYLYLIDKNNKRKDIDKKQLEILGEGLTKPFYFSWDAEEVDIGVYSLWAEVEVISGDEESNKNNNKIKSSINITVSLPDGSNIPIFSVSTSDPVDTATGNYTVSVTDISISGKAPIELVRSYNATDYKTSSLGPHWKHNYNIFYQDVEDYVKVYLEDGSVEFFDLLESGEYSFNTTKYKNVYYDSEGCFTIEFKGNKTYKFNEKYIGQITENANTTFITYENELLKKIESVSGFIEFFYEGDRIDYITDSAGRKVDYQYTNGNLTAITNVDGNTWNYEYDDKGLIIKSIDYASNVQLINVYDDASRVVEQINEDGSVTRYVHTDDTVTFTEKNGSETVYHKDSKGRLIFREYPDGNEKYVYDDNDNIIEFVDKNGSTYNYYYNDNGDLESSVDPLGQTTSYTYDGDGNVLSERHPDGSEITYTYNEAGKTTSVTDEIGRATRFIYDALYNVEKIILPNGSESIMAYYPNGNLHTITDADGNTTTYSYDSLNRIIEVKNAEGYITRISYLPSGKTEKVINPDGTSIQNMYDCEGQLVKTIDELGRETKYTYTPMGDIASIINPDNTETIFKYNAMQQVESITYADGSSVQNKYDNAGRLIKVTDQLENVQKFTYDNNGNVLTQKDGNGNITTYQYDKLNRQTAIINALNQKTQYSYRYDGKITSITDALNNVTSMEYDHAGQLIKEIQPNGNETSYTYDLLGQLSSITDAFGQVTTYEYNVLGKVTKITNPDDSYQTMTYDRIGNLISSINELGAETKFEYDSMSRLIKTIDALGNTTQMSYGLDSQLESIIDANGNTSSFQYDIMGRLIKETNPRGFDTTYSYDVLGNLTEVHKLNGSDQLTTTYEYNSKNQLIKEISPAGAVTLYTYDANGNITIVTDAEGYQTASIYDAVNNLINVTKPDNSHLQYVYDALNRVTEATDGEGNTTKYVYDSNGNILSETDPMGNNTNYSYDALNQLTSVTNAIGNTSSYTYRYDGKVETIRDAMNNLYKNEYDAAGQLIKEILPNNGTTSYTYDLLGRVSSITDAEGLVTEYTYDALGNTLKTAFSNAAFETMSYDANSNLIKTTDAMGNVTQYFYDFDDRLISVVDALGNEKVTAYTKDGQVSSITDGNGNQTKYEYNLLGKATKTIDGLGNEVNYTYDPVSNLREIHQYKGVTASTISLMNDAPSYTTELDEVILKYEYNTNGQLTKEINPSGTTVNYSYDKNGNLVSKQDEDGYVTTNTYDSVNNLTQVKYDSGKTVSYTYNLNNQITSMTDWLGTNTYDLDVLGRINTVTDYEGRVTGYTWNSRNQKLSMAYPDGSQVKYSYDIKGNLLKVLDGNGKETSYIYDALDRMTREVLPNGVTSTKSYDALSRITGETSAKKDGTVIYSNVYSLDREGNILSETKKTYENGNKLNICITNYIYDNNNQLIQTNDSEGILEKYFYDTLGNRIQKEVTTQDKKKSVTNISKYTYNNENQMLTLQGANEEVAGHYTNGEFVTFSYDNRGNVRSITTDSGTIGQYYFDDTNKMTYSINKMGIKSGYTYDGAGRRVKETLEHSNINVPEKASIHIQTPIEDLLDSNQNIALDVKKEINYVIDSTTFDNRVLMVYGMHTKTQRYTYGNGVIGLDSWNDMAEAWESINQKKHDEQLYYVKDFRGSVLALTDYKCKITTTYDYNAFGTPIEKNHVNDQGIRSNIYHYAGYIYDYTTSLYFVNARYYMPETGRFMAEDAFKGDGLNRYVYVRNNPLIFIDPMGLCGEGVDNGGNPDLYGYGYITYKGKNIPIYVPGYVNGSNSNIFEKDWVTVDIMTGAHVDAISAAFVAASGVELEDSTAILYSNKHKEFWLNGSGKATNTLFSIDEGEHAVFAARVAIINTLNNFFTSLNDYSYTCSVHIQTKGNQSRAIVQIGISNNPLMNNAGESYYYADSMDMPTKTHQEIEVRKLMTELGMKPGLLKNYNLKVSVDAQHKADDKIGYISVNNGSLAFTSKVYENDKMEIVEQKGFHVFRWGDETIKDMSQLFYQHGTLSTGENKIVKESLPKDVTITLK